MFQNKIQRLFPIFIKKRRVERLEIIRKCVVISKTYITKY